MRGDAVLTPRIRPGMTVGLTVGSRESRTSDHAGSRRSSGARLRRVPVLLAAMGSHGGGAVRDKGRVG
ncbi:MAG: hypothetical protein ACLRWP_17405 [Bilophila wadsworthia]